MSNIENRPLQASFTSPLYRVTYAYECGHTVSLVSIIFSTYVCKLFDILILQPDECVRIDRYP